VAKWVCKNGHENESVGPLFSLECTVCGAKLDDGGRWTEPFEFTGDRVAIGRSLVSKMISAFDILDCIASLLDGFEAADVDLSEENRYLLNVFKSLRDEAEKVYREVSE